LRKWISFYKGCAATLVKVLEFHKYQGLNFQPGKTIKTPAMELLSEMFPDSTPSSKTSDALWYGAVDQKITDLLFQPRDDRNVTLYGQLQTYHAACSDSGTSSDSRDDTGAEVQTEADRACRDDNSFSSVGKQML
jgi:hypothetical protein